MKAPLANTAPALLREQVSRSPDRCFVLANGRSYSYREFEREVRAHAGGLVAAGVGRGSRVGILMGNRVEWLVIYFAAMHLGAEVVALNTWLTGPELEYQLGHSRTELLVAEREFLGRDWTAVLGAMTTERGGDLPHLRGIVWVGPMQDGDGRIAELVTDSGELPLSPVPDAQDIACILYTSGSTAVAKGVPLLHEGLVHNMWCIGERMHLEPTDRLWLGVSLFWSFACVNAVFTLLTHGGSVVLQHHFEAGEALRLIEAHQCTVLYATPNMVKALSDHPDAKTRRLGSLRTGATLGTAEQLQRVHDFGVTEICNVYGLTEAYGNSAVVDCKMPLEHRLHFQGCVLESQRIRVVDPQTRRPLPAGATGEIELAGCVCKGYLDDPVRTAESFTADGYLKTGDLGRLNDAGFLQYRGRLKEMIKTNGINVSPAEVEEALTAHPSIEAAFVIGLPDARADEIVAAVIVLADRAQVPPEKELIAHCRERLAAYKVPRRFQSSAFDDLPQTSTGKLQRNRLHELF